MPRCWYVDPIPWAFESRLLSELKLRLILDQDRHGEFHATLSASWHTQCPAARSGPVLPYRPRQLGARRGSDVGYQHYGLVQTAEPRSFEEDEK